MATDDQTPQNPDEPKKAKKQRKPPTMRGAGGDTASEETPKKKKAAKSEPAPETPPADAPQDAPPEAPTEATPEAPTEATPETSPPAAEEAPKAPAPEPAPPPPPKPSILDELKKDTANLGNILRDLHSSSTEAKNTFKFRMLLAYRNALMRSSFLRMVTKIVLHMYSNWLRLYERRKHLIAFVLGLLLVSVVTVMWLQHLEKRKTEALRINESMSTGLDNIPAQMKKDSEQSQAILKRNQIAVIVSGLGMDLGVNETAIQKLPEEVTLAFSPNAPGLTKWIHTSRLQGHDTMLVIPFEPPFYPFRDPGPETLLTGRSVGENVRKLELLMKRAVGIVGFINTTGFRFSTSAGDLDPIMKLLATRDFIYIDSHLTGGDVYAKLAAKHKVRTVRCDHYLADVPNPQKMTEVFADIERIAAKSEFSVVVVEAYPQYLEYLMAWLNNLHKGNVQLVRISNLALITPNVSTLMQHMKTVDVDRAGDGRLDEEKTKSVDVNPIPIPKNLLASPKAPRPAAPASTPPKPASTPAPAPAPAPSKAAPVPAAPAPAPAPAPTPSPQKAPHVPVAPQTLS